MKNDRELKKMVSKMGLRREPRKVVVQYAKGFQEGLHIAYVSVAKKMLSAGQSEADVRGLLEGIVEKAELDEILEDAAG